MDTRDILETIRGAAEDQRAFSLYETVVVPHFKADYCELVREILLSETARRALLGNSDSETEKNLRRGFACGGLIESLRGEISPTRVLRGNLIFVVQRDEMKWLEHRISSGGILVMVDFDSACVMRPKDVASGEWSYEQVKRIAA